MVNYLQQSLRANLSLKCQSEFYHLDQFLEKLMTINSAGNSNRRMTTKLETFQFSLKSRTVG